MPKRSKAYMAVLDIINNDPELISALYDLNLVPELVDDKKGYASRQLMLAFVLGYGHAKGLNVSLAAITAAPDRKR